MDEVEIAYRRWINANIHAVEASRMQTPQPEIDRLWALEEQRLNEYTEVYNKHNPPIQKWWE